MNLFHDEMGRFCSHGVMQGRKDTLIQEGRFEEADQVDLGLRNATLNQNNPAGRARESAVKKLYKASLIDFDKAKNLESMKTLRMEYLSTDEGVLELQRLGKHELAKSHFIRRSRLAEDARKKANLLKTPIRVALDLDNTSGDFTGGLRDYTAKKRGMTREEALAKLPEPAHYNFAQSGWYESTEDFLTDFRAAESEGIYRKIRAYDGMKKNLQTLVANGDIEIHVVTARDIAWNADTRAWLKQNKIPFKTLTHLEDKEKAVGIDVYIDDSDKQINTLRSHGKTVIAFNNAYNEDVEAQYRVKHWDEVPSVLKMISSHRRSAPSVQIPVI